MTEEARVRPGWSDNFDDPDEPDAATGRHPYRLDRVLVSGDMARSRAVARELIQRGLVRVDGVVVTKPASTVTSAAQVEVADSGAEDGVRWVSRGADKLNAALRRWAALSAQVQGGQCVDVGASTGGFTQALLHAGACQVTAIDVGTAQLAQPIATDSRVVERSNTHILSVEVTDLDEPVGVIVVDLSFISLSRVVAHLESWCDDATSIVLLVKPQFEVGRALLGKNGIVRSSRVRTRALAGVLEAVYECGLGLLDAMNSPITGTHGNAEYLLWVQRSREGMMDRDTAQGLIRTLTAKRERKA